MQCARCGNSDVLDWRFTVICANRGLMEAPESAHAHTVGSEMTARSATRHFGVRPPMCKACFTQTADTVAAQIALARRMVVCAVATAPASALAACATRRCASAAPASPAPTARSATHSTGTSRDECLPCVLRHQQWMPRCQQPEREHRLLVLRGGVLRERSQPGGSACVLAVPLLPWPRCL